MTDENPAGRRLLTAVPTPFTPRGDVDTDTARLLAQQVARSRADGAFVAGTTGEFPSLAVPERIALFEAFCAGLQGKRLVAHVGSASLRESTTLVRAALDLGITELSAMTPYFLPASAATTRSFYEDLASCTTGARLYVYLFEARSTTRVTPGELAALAEIPGVVGAKLSGMDLGTVLRYRDAVPEDFEIYTGSDADFPALAGTGIAGVVSGVSSVVPEAFDRMLAAFDADDETRTRASSELRDVVEAVAGDIPRIRAGLEARGLPVGLSRMPLAPPDLPALERVRSILRRYGAEQPSHQQVS